LTLQHIDGAFNPSGSTIEDVGVNHRLNAGRYVVPILGLSWYGGSNLLAL